jgi:hypothetical protein
MTSNEEHALVFSSHLLLMNDAALLDGLREAARRAEAPGR